MTAISWKRSQLRCSILLYSCIHVNTKCGYYIAEETVVYAVSLESVLSGHENWIYSVKWQPPVNTGINRKIFSSSDLKGHT